MPIGSLLSADKAIEGVSQAQGIGSGAHSSFLDAISAVNGRVQVTEAAIADFLVTGRGDLNSLVIGTEEVRLRLAYLSQVRNKIVEAYQDITKMQI